MIASRPLTWGVAIAPVITGLAIALSDTGIFHLLDAQLQTLGSLLQGRQLPLILAVLLYRSLQAGNR